MNLKNFLFDGENSSSTATNVALTALRVFAGYALMTHGFGKFGNIDKFAENVSGIGFPMPIVFAWAAALSEFLGGIFLAFGFLTRVAAFFVAFTMSTALLRVHINDPFQKQELAFLYLFISLAFLLMGANKWSIDGFLRKM
jgi:putative oxidoreductase